METNEDYRFSDVLFIGNTPFFKEFLEILTRVNLLFE